MTLIVANWKMNGKMADVQAYAQALAGYKAVVCLPTTLLAQATWAFSKTSLVVGAQNCHELGKGAHTGDVSAAMLVEAGCRYVIVGHSERRIGHGESDAQVWAKAAAVTQAGMTPIVCVGEKQGEDVEVVLQRQLAGVVGFNGDSLVVAYEPIWAISANNSAGIMPTSTDIEKRHKAIKAIVEKIKPSLSITVIYGGSVKGENAAAILKTPQVDGVLVGGASLPVEAFKAVLDAAA